MAGSEAVVRSLGPRPRPRPAACASRESFSLATPGSSRRPILEGWPILFPSVRTTEDGLRREVSRFEQSNDGECVILHEIDRISG